MDRARNTIPGAKHSTKHKNGIQLNNTARDRYAWYFNVQVSRDGKEKYIIKTYISFA
jgi:hypothetical protein